MNLALYTAEAEANGFLENLLKVHWEEPILLISKQSLEEWDSRDTRLLFYQDGNISPDLGRQLREKNPTLTIIHFHSENGSFPPAYGRKHVLTEEKKTIDFTPDLEVGEEEILALGWNRFKDILLPLVENRELKEELESLEKNLSEWENIFQESLDIMFIIDARNKQIVEVNQTACLVLGYTKQDMIGRDFSNFTNQREVSTEMDSGFHGSSISNQGLVTIDSKWIPMESTWRLFEKDGITHIIATFRDISERKIAEDKIHNLAYYNAITNLPNKIYFEEKLKQTIQKTKAISGSFSLAILDIDNFKLINETLGPSIGDKILLEVGKRLLSFQFVEIFASHFGGDDFGIIMNEVFNIEEVEVAINQLQKILRKPILLEGHEFYLTFSLGIVLYPRHAENGHDLMRYADLAMYSAKEKGKNSYSIYSTRMVKAVHQRMEIENDLRKAIANEEFLLYYQPQISIETGKIIGMETLVRWNHPDKGLISPIEFIFIAEVSGLIHEIGLYVLKKSCSTTKRWLDEGLVDFPVSVNVSAKQWNSISISREISVVLKESGLPSQFLTIELTESSIMEDPEKSITAFKDLLEAGVCLSVDDFGTGYSSLSYLKKLHVHHLKIDKSFVSDLDKNENDRAISLAIINLAHSLGLNVIAEGVENEDQLEILKSQHCDSYQGYYASRPLPEKEFEELLKNYRQMEYVV